MYAVFRILGEELIEVFELHNVVMDGMLQGSEIINGLGTGR